MFRQSVRARSFSRSLGKRRPSPIVTYRIVGMGESYVEEAVGAESARHLRSRAGLLRADGRSRFAGDRFGRDPSNRPTPSSGRVWENLSSPRSARTSKTVIVRQLSAKKATLAVAESCTGGFPRHRLTNVPGASAVFLAGYVTYSNEAKVAALGVDAAAISKTARSANRWRARWRKARGRSQAPTFAPRHHRNCRTRRRQRGQAGRALLTSLWPAAARPVVRHFFSRPIGRL